MSTPVRRNDDSLATEFEWLKLPDNMQTSPASVWDPDYEEETVRRRVRRIEPLEPIATSELKRVEHAPQVCVLDESRRDFSVVASFASVAENKAGEQDIVEEEVLAPWSLSEISPQVHVPDELPLKVTEPWSLSEISPQVHVPDELPLKVTEPWSLSEISPQVHVPDELPLQVTEPWSLPDISPHVGALDDSEVLPEASLSTATGKQPVEPEIVEAESQSRPGKASWATEYLNQIKKETVKEKVAEKLRPENHSRVEQSDELQVLPGGASFTPVSLNQTGDDSDEDTVVRPRSLPEKSLRARRLDESQVLPGEASFATAISNESLAPRSYSPVAEFCARTNLNPKTLLMASLLVVSILGVSTLVVLEVKTGLFSSSQTVISSFPKATSLTERSDAEIGAGSAPVSKPKKEANSSNSSTSAAVNLGRVPGSPRQTFPERTNSQTSPKATAAAANPEKTRKGLIDGANSVASRAAAVRGTTRDAAGSGKAGSSKRVRAHVKEPPAAKKASGPRNSNSRNSKVTNTSSESRLKQRRTSSLAKDAAATKPKREVKTPSKSNGAQRPRTVTRSTAPGQ